jgi:hypothetical protein
MECEPTDNDALANVALPELNVAVPNVLLPSKKVTLPVGVPGAGTVTVAVNVTLWLIMEGLVDVLVVIDVGALLTVCIKTDEALPFHRASPLYAAVIEWEPTASDEVLKLTWPDTRGTLATTVDPSLKVTVPAGGPDEVIVAVNVTGCPKIDGLSVELSVVLVLGLKRTKGLKDVTLPHTVLVLKSWEEVTLTAVPFTMWNRWRLLNVERSLTVNAWKHNVISPEYKAVVEMSYAPKLLERERFAVSADESGVTDRVGSVLVVEPVILGKEMVSVPLGTPTWVVISPEVDAGSDWVPIFVKNTDAGVTVGTDWKAFTTGK